MGNKMFGAKSGSMGIKQTSIIRVYTLWCIGAAHVNQLQTHAKQMLAA